MGGACDTMGNRRGAHMVWWGDLKERKHLEGLDIDGG
jgi:hypothetical protein